MSYITDKIPKAFDYALLSRMILTDFQKSFDTTDHNILLIKVPSLGVSLEVIDWYKSYLSSRKFHVNVLFWTFVLSSYIIDVSQAVDCDLFLYADDTYLLFQHKDLERIKEFRRISRIYVTDL